MREETSAEDFRILGFSETDSRLIKDSRIVLNSFCTKYAAHPTPEAGPNLVPAAHNIVAYAILRRRTRKLTCIQSVPRSKHSVSVIRNNHLMPCSDVIAVCSDIHKKHTNKCRQMFLIQSWCCI